MNIKKYSLALLIATFFVQSTLSPLCSHAAQGLASKKAEKSEAIVFNIALTPGEADHLGIDDFRKELLKEARASESRFNYTAVVSVLMTLSVNGIALVASNGNGFGVAAANFFSIPFHAMNAWIIKKLVFSTHDFSEGKLRDAFDLIKFHADKYCSKKGYLFAAAADKRVIQSATFTDEDFKLGRVYLDGVPLSLEDANILDSTKENVYYIFNKRLKCVR